MSRREDRLDEGFIVSDRFTSMSSDSRKGAGGGGKKTCEEAESGNVVEQSWSQSASFHSERRATVEVGKIRCNATAATVRFFSAPRQHSVEDRCVIPAVRHCSRQPNLRLGTGRNLVTTVTPHFPQMLLNFFFPLRR